MDAVKDNKQLIYVIAQSYREVRQWIYNSGVDPDTVRGIATNIMVYPEILRGVRFDGDSGRVVFVEGWEYGKYAAGIRDELTVRGYVDER